MLVSAKNTHTQYFNILKFYWLILPWLSCEPIQGLSLCVAHLRMRRKSESLLWKISQRTWMLARQCHACQTGWSAYAAGRDSCWPGGSKERPSTGSLIAAFLSNHLEKKNEFHKHVFVVVKTGSSQDWSAICLQEAHEKSSPPLLKLLLFIEQVCVSSQVFDPFPFQQNSQFAEIVHNKTFTCALKLLLEHNHENIVHSHYHHWSLFMFAEIFIARVHCIVWSWKAGGGALSEWKQNANLNSRSAQTLYFHFSLVNCEIIITAEGSREIQVIETIGLFPFSKLLTLGNQLWEFYQNMVVLKGDGHFAVFDTCKQSW